MTDEIEATWIVRAPRADVYPLLRDVAGYDRYSEYVRNVTGNGDGGVGTTYAIDLSWWKLSYTLRARVTDLDPPERIAWQVTEDLDASGEWRLDPASVDDPAIEAATRVTLTARFDPESADEGSLSLPPLVPTSTVVDRARPIVEAEAQRVVDRVVADLEGEPRHAQLSIWTRSDGG